MPNREKLSEFTAWCARHITAGGKLTPVSPEELERARHLIESFLAQRPVDINSAEELARRLANLTHVIRDIIIGAFQTGAASQQWSYETQAA